MIVGGGGFQGLPMLRSLREAGARVVIADSIQDNVNRYWADDYIVVPPASDESAFVEAIMGICVDMDVDIVLPVTDHVLLPISLLSGGLRARGTTVAVPPAELLADLLDKGIWLRGAASSGLPVLPLVDPSAQTLQLPILGKPRRGWGSKGMVTVANQAELAAAQTDGSGEDLVWQPKLTDFTEWSVDFAISQDGRVSPLVARERLRTSGGFAVISRVDAEAPVLSLAERTAGWVSAQGGCGLFNIQVLIEPSGQQWLNDLNCRPGTSSTATLGVGANLVAFLLGLPPTDQSPSNVVHVRTIQDVFLPAHDTEPVRGAAFDLDDCIIDQKAWMDDKLAILLEGWRSAPSELKQAFESEATRLVDEGPWDRLIDVALKRIGGDPALAPLLIARWRAAHPAGVTVYRDAERCIIRLKEAGVRVAVVTDNPAESQRQKLSRLSFSNLFDLVVLTDELGEPKPSPAGYEAAAKGMGLRTGEMIAVGDSPWRDAVGSLRAGLPAAYIRTRVGAMGNPEEARFARAYPQFAPRTHWLDSLFALPTVLGLARDPHATN